MASAAMDSKGDIALGYSKSSGSIYPSIAYASRTPGMSPGTMGTENTLLTGLGAQTGPYSRWGDYTALRIDPSDDTTFWYTNEYYTQNSPFVWSTAIGSFAVGGGSPPPPPPPSPDFSVSVSPNPLMVNRGSSGVATVSVTAINGPSSVNLSVSGLPNRTSANFSTNPVTTPGTSSLTVSVGRKATPGTYGLMISGNNVSVPARTTTLSLTIIQ
jgi:hypothetical protein